MIIFPFIYIYTFFIALLKILYNKAEAVLLFLIFGLPVYITAISVCNLYGFTSIIPVLQSFKEMIILTTLTVVLLNLKKKIHFHLVDKLVLSYFLLVLLYALIPLGPNTLLQRLLSLKSIAFFPMVYFTGRMIDPSKIYLNKYLNYICLLSLAAAIVVLLEVILNRHLQTLTGYADFMYRFFNQESTGNYGLSWTFETQNGLRRFASFFATPLDLAAASVISVAVIFAAVTTNNNQLKFNYFYLFTILATLISITFALSRASFVSYFILFYLYLYITKRKYWLLVFNTFLLGIAILAGILLVKSDVIEYIITTLNFSNSSSLSHIIDWLAGIESIGKHPFGLGLGTSGNAANSIGSTSIGGENQLFIIGVQAGILPMLLYTFLYGSIIYYAIRYFNHSTGKRRKLALMVLLIKVGLIIPTLTSELESFNFISYISWFFTGYLFNICNSYTLFTNRLIWERK